MGSRTNVLWRVGNVEHNPCMTVGNRGETGLRPAFWLALAAVLAAPVAAEQVVRVKDGDSLVISSGDGQVDVRLADIDAPEHRQPHGDAGSALRALVDGREVRLQLVGGDAYRRIVAHVFVDEMHVNAEMVRSGHAWVRRAYDPAPRLVADEDAARVARRGLWAAADPVPPWEWRRASRGARRAASIRSQQAGAGDQGAGDQGAGGLLALATIPKVRCGAKRYCKEMSSCEEAVAFLRQCGVSAIDGDKDGMPCEKLCRGVAR